MTIGAVLAQLRPEFPDVTISKIRFLEAEGLISPARTESGHRQFGEADVARLRYVLAAQRDRYLPLKVIREQLAAGADLEQYGLLAADPDTVRIAAAVGALAQILTPLRSHRDPATRAGADEVQRQLVELSVRLRTLLVKAGLRAPVGG